MATDGATNEVTHMGRHKQHLIPAEETDWYHALTIKAGAECFPATVDQIRRAVVEGRAYGWKPGLEWFVSALSLKRLFGNPKNPELLLEKLPHIR